MMQEKAGKVWVVESDDLVRAQLLSLLTDAGYEVTTDVGGGMRAVLASEPDVVILGADPPQLSCCDLLSEIKSSKHTQNIKVLMLSPGGTGERIRGLDLGADDVMSLPFSPDELLSRIRSQLRSKNIADEFRERYQLVEQDRNATQQVVTAVNEERRTLRVWGAVTAVVLIAIALVLVLFYRHSQQQNVRVYAAITRLQTGVITQQQLIERSRQALESQAHNTPQQSDAEKLQLQKKSEDLRSQITSGNTQDSVALRTQLAAVEGRLRELENEGSAAHTIIETDRPSICLIHVVLAFRDRTSALKLHYASITDSGGPATDQSNNPLVSLTGNGPEVHLDVFGTGFLVSSNGQILTNHHVAEPWWQNDEIKEMVDQGLEPEIEEMTAYFPNVTHGITVRTQRISSRADIALVTGDISGLGLKEIALADGHHSAVGGSPVVLLGYPTGVDAILARTGPEVLQSIAASTKGDPKQVMEELARRHLIVPIVTQGHIGNVLPDKIIYDAQTTSGGSGGPLFDSQGKVIGINFAMVRDFGGSNFAIPIGFGESLLKP
jgi:DNA-binding response OmpR family regulator/S1-C subfamily serine protease